MPDQLPFVACLCPTYHRPALLANAIACFIAQDYPPERRHLFVLDDAGQVRPVWHPGWSLRSMPVRFGSLPEKYNAMRSFAAMAAPEASVICIWEDDDIYNRWHISAHVAAIQAGARWSKPSKVLSTYTGQPEQEDAAGRFFASIAVTRELWDACGGIVATRRADFDQQSLARFAAIGGPPGDPLEFSPGRTPGYCFRFGTTQAYHGQSAMRGADDESWYDRCKDSGDATPIERLTPRMDAETEQIYARFIPQASPAAPAP